MLLYNILKYFQNHICYRWQIGKRCYIVISGLEIFFVYKKHQSSVITINNIKC